MKSAVNLIIFILDDITFKYKILSTKEDSIVLPSIIITPYLDIDKSIKHLISKYIESPGIDEYINYKISDIYIDENINLYYYTFITYNINIKNSYKVSIDKYENNLQNIQKIIKSL